MMDESDGLDRGSVLSNANIDDSNTNSDGDDDPPHYKKMGIL